jgi:tetratricopeptide (TPR) repeat protein
MNIRQSMIVLAGAALLCCGCATPKTGATAGTARAANTSTNAADDSSAASGLVFSPSGEVRPRLSVGKGNVESLAHFAAGEGYETNGQHELAVEEFYKSVMADPANEPLALELAHVYLDTQHPDKAVTLLSKVAERTNASAPIYGWLARAHLQAGNTNAALAASRKAIERWPDSLDGYESQLEILVRTGKTEGGLRVLDQAAKHIRNEPASLVALADLYSEFISGPSKEISATHERAIALLDRAAVMKIPSPMVLEQMADTYARLGESQKALAAYNKLLAEPTDDSLRLNTRRYKAALASMDAQDLTNATKLFKTVVTDNPGQFPEAWYYLGIMAHADNRLADASADFVNALRWDANLQMAYYRLALVFADLDHPNEAVGLLQEAHNRFIDSFTSQFYSGVVNMRVKDYDEAVLRFSAAETIAKTNNPAALDVDFYFQLGAALERDKKFPQAEQYLQKCIDMKPDNAEALNYLGFMWADLGEQLPKARAYIEKANKLDPNNAAFLDSLGWVFYKLKQPQDALPWMLKAVQLSTEPDATILDHLGDVYMALRQPAKALESWKKSLTIEPNDDVKKKLHLFDAGAT